VVKPAALVLLAALALLAAFTLPAAAEVGSSVTLSGYATLARLGEEAVVSALLHSRLDLQSRGNENVRGQLQLDGWVGEEAALDVPRAWLRVRLPWLHVVTPGREGIVDQRVGARGD